MMAPPIGRGFHGLPYGAMQSTSMFSYRECRYWEEVAENLTTNEPAGTFHRVLD